MEPLNSNRASADSPARNRAVACRSLADPNNEESGGTIDAIFIPSSDFVGNDRSFFERDPVDQCIDLGGRRGVREQLVGNSADDFMTGWAVSKRTANEQNDCA
jgi:hypothetical protein